MAILTIQEVGATIARCCEVYPPNEQGGHLHEDVNCMVELYASMIHFHMDAIASNHVKPEIMQTLERWGVRPIDYPSMPESEDAANS